MKSKLSIWVLLCFFGCASKHKLLHQTKEMNFTLDIKEIEEAKRFRYLNYTTQNDSVKNIYWFKLYPKGTVQFGNGNFTGELDSLIGYQNSVNSRKTINLQRNDSLLKSWKKATLNVSTVKETKFKEKQKLETQWWFLLLSILVLTIGFYKFKIR